MASLYPLRIPRSYLAVPITITRQNQHATRMFSSASFIHKALRRPPFHPPLLSRAWTGPHRQYTPRNSSTFASFDWSLFTEHTAHSLASLYWISSTNHTTISGNPNTEFSRAPFSIPATNLSTHPGLRHHIGDNAHMDYAMVVGNLWHQCFSHGTVPFSICSLHL